MMRDVIRASAALAAIVLLVDTGVAQDVPATPSDETTAEAPLRAPIVTLDKELLFEGSMMGQALIGRLEDATRDLSAENRRLEQALEQEERDLTERRKTLPQDEFRTLASEFDARVEQLRSAQDAKSRALTRRHDEDRQRFFEATVPVLGQLMSDVGAVAIVDRSAIILTFDRLDITALAIERLNAELGEGPSDLIQSPVLDSTEPPPVPPPGDPIAVPNP
jgi:Skp family chaperone for outer membrane proteins